jgi:hypothetical protein
MNSTVVHTPGADARRHFSGEPFMMNRWKSSSLTCGVIVAAVLTAMPASAQQGGAASAAGAPAAAAQPMNLQTALANDVGTLSDKFVGLARVMAGKYDWKPGEGVRSVGEVFNLIVMENKMLAGLLSGAQPPGGGMGGRGNAVSDPAEMQEALRSSYATLKQALSGLSDSDMKTSVKIFGRDTTKQGAAMMLLGDQHEHLGQSIAYARSNSIAPPWSK